MRVSVRQAGKKGRGVFARRPIRAGTIIEACPLLVISRKDWKIVQKTNLENYVFGWNKGSVAIALGNGSLYTHSENPNCQVIWEEGKDMIYYQAARSIRKGEELCINYGCKPTGYTPELDSGLKASA